MPRRLTRLAGATASAAGRVTRSVPGVAATGCAVAGAWLLFGLGWALIAAVPFLLAMDRRV